MTGLNVNKISNKLLVENLSQVRKRTFYMQGYFSSYPNDLAICVYPNIILHELYVIILSSDLNFVDSNYRTDELTTIKAVRVINVAAAYIVRDLVKSDYVWGVNQCVFKKTNKKIHHCNEK